MYSNACSLRIQGIFSSGILMSIENGEIISITSVNLSNFADVDCTVWIQLGSQHSYLIMECNAKVIFSSSIPKNQLNQLICSFLVLIRITDYTFSHLDFEPLLPVTYFTCCPIIQGDNVLLVGSPFGPLCPQVLFNNQFRGIVSISIGSDLRMLLIDLFCPYGLVGAPVFIIKNDLPLLYGLLINDSSIANKNINDFNFSTIFPVISILEIFLLLHEHKPYFDCLVQLSRFSPIINPIAFKSYSSLIPQTVLSRVVKVQNGNISASGILIDDNICLTCAHVVYNLIKGEIIHVTNSSGLVPYKLLFATPSNMYPDIAFLIKLGTTTPTDLFDNSVQFCKEINIGRQILSISFQNLRILNSNPAITLGCINKVVKHEDKILFGQSSCCIGPGSSGGLVIDRNSFEIIGIISGFTKIDMLGVTYFYPQMSRFIPFGIINRFWYVNISENSVEFIQNDDVQSLWNYTLSKEFIISKL